MVFCTITSCNLVGGYTHYQSTHCLRLLFKTGVMKMEEADYSRCTNEGPQILGATIRNFVAQVTSCLKFVYSCSKMLKISPSTKVHCAITQNTTNLNFTTEKTSNLISTLNFQGIYTHFLLVFDSH